MYEEKFLASISDITPTLNNMSKYLGNKLTPQTKHIFHTLRLRHNPSGYKQTVGTEQKETLTAQGAPAPARLPTGSQSP